MRHAGCRHAGHWSRSRDRRFLEGLGHLLAAERREESTDEIVRRREGLEHRDRRRLVALLEERSGFGDGGLRRGVALGAVRPRVDRLLRARLQIARGGILRIDREELTDRANRPLERSFREARPRAAQHVLHLARALDLAPGRLDRLAQLQDVGRLRRNLDRLREDPLGRLEPSLLQLDARRRDELRDLLALFLRRDLVGSAAAPVG